MAIIFNLDPLMKKYGITSAELANQIGITEANLSNIKNNKGFIKRETLDSLCKVLGCQPGDLMFYRENEKDKVIPLFLDYSGTTDHLLSGGAENVQSFFNSIIELQSKSDCEIQCFMVTGSSYSSANSKYKLLNELASNSGLPNLFKGAVAEYCGYLAGNTKQSLLSMDPRILEKKFEIEAIAEKYSAGINDDVTSYFNIQFNDTLVVDGIERPLERADISRFEEEIAELMNNTQIETSPYFDEYGKECDIKPVVHNKAKAVEMIVDILLKKYDVPLVIIGGDSQEEDLKMYTGNKDKFKAINLPCIFMAPSNIGPLNKIDNNIIVGQWENAEGIIDCIQELCSRIKTREDGGIEYE